MAHTWTKRGELWTNKLWMGSQLLWGCHYEWIVQLLLLMCFIPWLTNREQIARQRFYDECTKSGVKPRNFVRETEFRHEFSSQREKRDKMTGKSRSHIFWLFFISIFLIGEFDMTNGFIFMLDYIIPWPYPFFGRICRGFKMGNDVTSLFGDWDCKTIKPSGHVWFD